MINMKSSKYSDTIRDSTHRNGKVKSVPAFEENVSVAITKNACLEYDGSSSPSTQKKICSKISWRESHHGT